MLFYKSVIRYFGDTKALRIKREMVWIRVTHLLGFGFDRSDKRGHDHHGHGEESAPHLEQQVLLRRARLTLHSVEQKAKSCIRFSLSRPQRLCRSEFRCMFPAEMTLSSNVPPLNAKHCHRIAVGSDEEE